MTKKWIDYLIFSYVDRYTEVDRTTGQNLIDVNDTSVVCATGEEKICNEETNNSVAHLQQQVSSELQNYVLPVTFPNVASILEHWDDHIVEKGTKFGFRWRKLFTCIQIMI